MPVVLAGEVPQSKRRRRAAVDGEDFVSGLLGEVICLAHGNLPSQHPDDVLAAVMHPVIGSLLVRALEKARRPPMVAPLRHANPLRNCPLIGEDRK
jgi:hypothetical protein